MTTFIIVVLIGVLVVFVILADRRITETQQRYEGLLYQYRTLQNDYQGLMNHAADLLGKVNTLQTKAEKAQFIWPAPEYPNPPDP